MPMLQFCEIQAGRVALSRRFARHVRVAACSLHVLLAAVLLAYTGHCTHRVDRKPIAPISGYDSWSWFDFPGELARLNMAQDHTCGPQEMAGSMAGLRSYSFIYLLLPRFVLRLASLQRLLLDLMLLL